MIEPIRPEQVAQLRKETLPYFVIESFNRLIAQNYNHGKADVSQSDVIREILASADDPDIRERDIFDKNWLDVEEVYSAAGWIVEYDKPAYDENYPAFFTFKRGKSG